MVLACVNALERADRIVGNRTRSQEHASEIAARLRQRVGGALLDVAHHLVATAGKRPLRFAHLVIKRQHRERFRQLLHKLLVELFVVQAA